MLNKFVTPYPLVTGRQGNRHEDDESITGSNISGDVRGKMSQDDVFALMQD